MRRVDMRGVDMREAVVRGIDMIRSRIGLP